MPAPSILVVDDDPDIRQSILLALQLEGFEAREASDGKEALAVLHQNPDIGLILLDLMMPGMSGWEFLDAKRDDRKLFAIPTIVLTAYPDPAPRPDVLQFLKKPIEPPELLSVLRKHLRTSPHARAHGRAAPPTT